MSAIIRTICTAVCCDCKEDTALFASCFKNGVTWCNACQKDITIVVEVYGDKYMVKGTKVQAEG